MIASRFVIERKKLDKAPEDERTLFLALGHFSNQAGILGKWAAWAKPYEAQTDFERKGRSAQAIMVLTLLAAKLNEGWELLNKQYYGSKVSREYGPKLEPPTQEALKELGRYFNDERNAIRMCRHRYAFHYDADEIKRHYATLHQDEDTDIYLCDFPACNLFHAAEAAAGHALLEELGNGDKAAGMNRLVLETMNVSMLFQRVTEGLAIKFFERIGVPKGEQIEIAGLPAYDDMSLAFLSEGPTEPE